MTKLTKEQQKKIMNETQEILDSLSEGKSTKDVMAEIYVKNLDDKTLRQGEVMADAILESVKEFDGNYEHAKNNIDGFIDSFQKKANAGKTPAERCTYWLRFAASLSAVEVALGKDGTISEEMKNEIVSQVEALSVSEEEATEAYEEELMAQAKEAMLDSDILLLGIMNSSEEITADSDADDVTELLIDFGSKEIDFRAIMSMLVYTKTRNGEFGEDSADMTVEQVTTMVCTQVEEARILDAVGKGSMTEQVAAKLFKALGIVVIGAAMSLLVFGVGLPIYIILGAIFGVLLPPMDWVVCSAFFYGVWKLVSKSYTGWEKVNGKVFNVVKVGVKAIGNGCMKLAFFGRDHVILPAIQAAKKLLDKLVAKKNSETDQDVVTVDYEEVDEDVTVENSGEAVLA